MSNNQKINIIPDPNFRFNPKNRYDEQIQRSYANWKYTIKSLGIKSNAISQIASVNKYGSKFDPNFKPKPNNSYPSYVQASYHDLTIRDYMEEHTITGKLIRVLFGTTKVVLKIVLFPVLVVKYITDLTYGE